MLRPLLALLSLMSMSLTLACLLHGQGVIAKRYPNALETNLLELWYHTYTYNGDIHFRLTWTLLAPTVYVALYASARPTRRIAHRLMHVSFATYVFLMGMLFGAAEPDLPPRAAPGLAFIAITVGRAVPPAWRRHRESRRAAYLARGLCPTCGYDLRATPTHCPECGFFADAPK